MTYVGRIVGRLGAAPLMAASPAPFNVAVKPTMRISSPLVEADQRLSLPSFARIVPGATRRRRAELAGRIEEGPTRKFEPVQMGPLEIDAVASPQPVDTTVVSRTVVASGSAVAPAPIEPARAALPQAERSTTRGASDAESVSLRQSEHRSSSPPITATPTPISEDTNEEASSTPKNPIPSHALMTALAQLDAWMAKNQETADGFDESSGPSDGRPESAIPAARVDATSKSRRGSALYRASARAARAPAMAMLEASARTLRAIDGMEPKETAQGTPMKAPAAALAHTDGRASEAPRGMSVNEAQAEIPRNSGDNQAALGPVASLVAATKSALEDPILARPMPRALEAMQPRLPTPSPVAWEAPVLSIGNIEVEVVLPDRPPAPAAAIPARVPALHVTSRFEPPQHAFGWRQS